MEDNNNINFVFDYNTSDSNDASNLSFIFGGIQPDYKYTPPDLSETIILYPQLSKPPYPLVVVSCRKPKIFNCNDASLINDSNDFITICNNDDINFGFITIDDGSSLRVNIDVTSKLSFSDGSNVNININYHPFITLSSLSLIGDNLKPFIQHHRTYAAKITSGENFVGAIKTSPSMMFNATINDGSALTTELLLSPSFKMSSFIYSGSYVVLNLSSSVALESKSYIGENFKSSLNTSASINPRIHSGDILFSELKTVEPIIFDIKINSGDTLKSVIQTNKILPPKIYVGDLFISDIDYRPSKGIEVNVYNGDSFKINTISSELFYSPLIYTGDMATAEIANNPPFKIISEVSAGENLISNFSYSQGLKPKINYGDNVTISLGTLPNWVFTSGEQINVQVATLLNLSSKSSNGDNLKVDLKYGEKIDLNDIRGYHGEQINYVLTVQRSTYFKIDFHWYMEFIPTIWDTTYIDLNRYDCCPPTKYDLLNIDLQKNKEVEIRYDIPHQTKVLANLNTNPILYPKIYNGESFKIKEYNNLLSVHCYHGDSVNILDLYNDLKVDLVSGNFEYIDNIVIETDKNYPSLITGFSHISDGTSMSCDIGVSQQFIANMYDGYSLFSGFNYESAWRFFFYGFSGLHATINTNIKLYPKFQSGDVLRHRFYEDPIKFQSGESMKCEISIEYEVEFIENGCLPNDYIPITEDGIPIIDDMNEMAIEGHYYSHYIKGRCF